MRPVSDDIAEEAVAWHLRQHAMDAADWQRFVDWLEADARHAEAFDRLALADGALKTLFPAATTTPRPLPVPANDCGTPGWKPARWIGGLAACAAAVAAILVMRPAQPDLYRVETRPGETRQIALDEGSRVEMAGGSLLLLDRTNARRVVLERGEALFHVRHDAKAPFTVRSGDLEVLDVGTVFNVSRAGKRFSLAVSEGAVTFQPQGDALTLAAGDTLDVREDRGEVRRGKIAPAQVGGWKAGRLAFSDTPVPEALADITRLSGTQFVTDPALSSRRVTGIMTLSGKAQRDVPHIASLIGASWRTDGERWYLSPAGEDKP